MTNAYPIHRDMVNEFGARTGPDTINFVNRSDKRDNVSQIEIYSGSSRKAINVKPEDNVAMALSILGVGRVTDDIEERAQRWAGTLSEEEFLKDAVTALRTLLIIRQRKAEEESNLTADAYALYKLSYPTSNITRYEFESMGIFSFWTSNLKKIRKDPTVLGAL